MLVDLIPIFLLVSEEISQRLHIDSIGVSHSSVGIFEQRASTFVEDRHRKGSTSEENRPQSDELFAFLR